jgi:N-acetyl-alpha-D-glucosaminyl L-malate synthase BshA
MKIVILSHGFPPYHLGGTELATYDLTKNLARIGHEVHVITRMDSGLPKNNFEEGFYVHRISWRKIRFLGGLLFLIMSLRCLKKIKPDIIHTQSISEGLPAIIFKRVLNTPSVIWAQGSDVYQTKFLDKILLDIVTKNADAVIALTEDMREKLKKIYNGDIFVIPNGVDLKRFKYLSRKEIRNNLNITDDERIILFVGNLRPVKGVKYLIQAMKLINDKNRYVRLFVVGAGPERDYLENLTKELDLKKYINFVGRVSSFKIPEYMIASDLFVLPSLSEGLPLVILEAMASGLPIIASKIGGLPEIVRDKENGFIIEPQQVEKISENILLLLENDNLREQISKNNKDKVKEFDWEAIAVKLEKIYATIIKIER